MGRSDFLRRQLERLDRWFGASMEEDFGHAIRCRTLAGASLSVAILTLGYLAIIHNVDGHISAPRVVGIVGGLVVSCTPLVLAWTRNLTLSAFLFLVVFQGVLVFGAYGTGGIHSNVAPTLLVAPVLSGFLLGWRHSLIFAFVTLLVYVWLTVATAQQGLLPVHYDTQAQLAVARGAALILAIFAGAASFMGLASLNSESRARLLRAKDAAEGANRLKSHFIANMSHEIRTPLNGVLGMAKVLTRTPLNEDQQEFVQMIERSGLSLFELVNDLLEISMIETEGHAEEIDENFDVAWMFRAAVERAEMEAAAKGLVFETHLTADVSGHSLAHARRLKRVLTVLVDNAVKFTDKGSVCIGCECRAGATLHFRVTDTGPGIEPGEHDLIFDRFYQTDRSLGRRHGGSGLGLAIAKRIVEAAGGRIGVQSMPGVGSCFWFEVPISPEQPCAEEAPLPKSAAA